LDACAQGHTIVVETSTLPVRTAEVITTILAAAESNTPSGRRSFAVLSNPEFLAEGTAISDLETPRSGVDRRRRFQRHRGPGRLRPLGAGRAHPAHQPLEQ
jgi:hypothetical protein